MQKDTNKMQKTHNETQNDHKGTQNNSKEKQKDYKETQQQQQNNYKDAKWPQSAGGVGALLLVPVPRARNLSIAEGYLELQIEAIHWHSFTSAQKFLNLPQGSSNMSEAWPVSQVIILTTVYWMLICGLSLWSPIGAMSWHEDTPDFESEFILKQQSVQFANSLDMCCFPFSTIRLPT